MLIQELRTAVLNNSSAHAAMNILRFAERVDTSVQIVPPNITSERPYHERSISLPTIRR